MVKRHRIVLDTNIIISAVIYKGKLRQIMDLVLTERVNAVSSSVLLAELMEVLSKIFLFPLRELHLLEQQINEIFEIVYPKNVITIQKDKDDNRVLEAAVTGNCEYIITGDKELLSLASFQGIKIMKASEFLDYIPIK